MNIVKAKPIELVETFYLLKTHLREMNSKGWMYRNLQFELLRKEIEEGSVFIYKNDFLSLGLIILHTKASEDYENVTWIVDSKKPLFVSFLIEHPKWRKYGIARQLLTFAEEFAKDQGFTSLRVDAYGGNQEIITLFNDTKYQNTGQILIEAQKVPFYCFEKKVG